jgi:hypothetical protein
MKGENLIHIKLEYDESLETKKNILNTEKDLINLLRTIKHYHTLRSEELRKRLSIQKKIKELKLNITKLEQVLPKIRIPEILKKETTDVIKEPVPKKIKKEDYDKNIEEQLREIQEKLKRLG